MPLTGDAKREYQREYMRKTRRALAKAERIVAKVGGKPLSGCSAQSAAASMVSQEMLGETLDRHAWTLDRHIAKRIALTEHERTHVTKDGVTITAPDGDVQCRAMDAMDEMLERAGRIPTTVTSALGGTSVTIIGMHYNAPQQVVVGTERDALPVIDVVP